MKHPTTRQHRFEQRLRDLQQHRANAMIDRRIAAERLEALDLRIRWLLESELAVTRAMAPETDPAAPTRLDEPARAGLHTHPSQEEQRTRRSRTR